MDTEVYRTNVVEEFVVQEQVKNHWIEHPSSPFETLEKAVTRADALARVDNVYRVVRRTK